MKTMAILCALLLASAANAQTGAITGRVATDEGDGLAGVTVLLVPFRLPARSTPTTPERAVTDEDGRFRFTSVGPGLYSVTTFATKQYAAKVAASDERGMLRAGDDVALTLVRGGVITGRVTDAAGESAIGLSVVPILIRDADGVPLANPVSGRARITDDRGIYRLYGLSPGGYIVVARVAPGTAMSAYDDAVPTFHPSAPRETAAEIQVIAGGEARSVDIRFRSEPGRLLSGTIGGGPAGASSFASVALYDAASGFSVTSAPAVRSPDGKRAFALRGVPDGEYDLVARLNATEKDPVFSSAPRRIVVRGADLGGLDLTLLPRASIAGKVVVEAGGAACEKSPRVSFEEILLRLQTDPNAKPAAAFLRGLRREDAPDARGEFEVGDLDAATYFSRIRLPNGSWYVRGLARTAADGKPEPLRGGLTVKAGERVAGLSLSIANGAGSLEGKIVPARDGAKLPARLRVHLVPADAKLADDPLRYAETLARADGAFAFANLAPGNYLLLARPVPADEPADRSPLPAAWESAERAKLRKEAETRKVELDVTACGQAKGAIARY